MIALAIIPARYDSSRFPGKPLANRTGKPLIQHVVEQVRRAQTIIRILVATDDQRIFDAVQAFGGEAVMTRSDHLNGTSRLAEVVTSLTDLPTDLIVNVQGDEPEIEPAVIDQLVATLDANPQVPMATLRSPFADDEDPADPNLVKVVVDQQGHALYFSRALIPLTRDATPIQCFKHPGLYAYRRAFLLRYPDLPPTPLEQAEKLEQLRVLEHGHRMITVQVHAPHPGIDTPQQYDQFVQRQRRRSSQSVCEKRPRA